MRPGGGRIDLAPVEDARVSGPKGVGWDMGTLWVRLDLDGVAAVYKDV